MTTSTVESHWVGKRYRRREDSRLMFGKGQYLADLAAPGMAHLVFVRATHAHARLKGVDTSAAAKLPGVLAVITGAQLKNEINGFPLPVVVPALPARYPKFFPLAIDKVKFHGEPVAAVVAVDKYQAEDAALAVRIEYEPLPVVLDAETALKPGATKVHDDWPDNTMFELTFTGGQTIEDQNKNDAEVEQLFRQADVVIRERFKVHRCGVTPMETRGTLAIWDPSDGLTAYITTQRPHIDRLALADVLSIPPQRIRVVAPRDQGGGFGVKAPYYREPNLVCHMARKLGRPVRWLETREEHLLAVSQERDQVHYLEVAAKNDGTIMAVRDRGIGDAGDGCEGVYWGYLMPFLGSALLPNAYDLPKCDIKL
ncbi:MAG: xanthine dehydrogenase family protein molybdopterin-binding subunit, partial [Alphaproteobacteria bacterium]|nr:xanthine dehydrogenase family protein molybdopterin-binding subunit [Alphaproteobacteria bacterium]